MNQIYDDVILDFISLQNDLNLKKPAQIFSMYDFALYNGYLSFNKTFEYRVNPIYDKGNLGYAVLCGGGCCIHTTKMFSDILRLNGLKNKIIDVRVFKDGREVEPLKGIERLFGNHVINMIIEKKTAHYFDTTARLIYGKSINELYTFKRPVISRCSPFIRMLPAFNNDEDYKIYHETKKLIYDNIDKFEWFYGRNMLDYMRLRDKCNSLRKEKVL